jgi:hypothetical protein
VEYKKNFERLALQSFQNLSWVFRKHKALYSNPKWFVEAHPEGVHFHKPQKSTNDLGLLYVKIETKVSYLNK